MGNWKMGIIVLIFLGVILMTVRSMESITIIDGNNISSVSINGNRIEDKELVADLVKVLSAYETLETDNPFPIESNKIEMEISYLNNEKPRHIILGDINVIYESADLKVFEIINGDILLIELNHVLTKYDGMVNLINTIEIDIL